MASLHSVCYAGHPHLRVIVISPRAIDENHWLVCIISVRLANYARVVASRSVWYCSKEIIIFAAAVVCAFATLNLTCILLSLFTFRSVSLKIALSAVSVQRSYHCKTLLVLEYNGTTIRERGQVFLMLKYSQNKPTIRSSRCSFTSIATAVLFLLFSTCSLSPANAKRLYSGRGEDEAASSTMNRHLKEFAQKAESSMIDEGIKRSLLRNKDEEKEKKNKDTMKSIRTTESKAVLIMMKRRQVPLSREKKNPPLATALTRMTPLTRVFLQMTARIIPSRTSFS